MHSLSINVRGPRRQDAALRLGQIIEGLQG
jgi:hypothetical protein